jgi:hypothetical protein
MPGVPRELVEHALNVDPKAKPVKQPLRRFDEPKRKAIASELHRLENTGFIREINSSTWVSNPVIVPKKNTDIQRVCVVVGMTSGVCQGMCYLPAGVPGISTALGREDRLRPKGQQCQQPAVDSTDESQSRAMKTRILQRLFRRKWPGPDKIDRGKGRE